MVGHFDPSWINVVSGTLFGFFEYMVGIMKMAGGEAVDKEEDEEEYLVFRTGAGGSGTMESGDEFTHQILSYGLLFLTFYRFPYTAGPPTSTAPTRPSPTFV